MESRLIFVNLAPVLQHMATTTLHIRNMVCNRCILVVQQLLEGLGLTPLHIELGKAIVQEELPPEAKAALKTALEAVGFELIDGRRSLLIERLRNAVIELAHYHDDGMRTNLSDYLSEKFHSDYSALSKLFSEMTGITLEKYYIAQRVERVKELLVYNELSLGQIADQTQLFEHGAPERPVQKRHGHNAQRIPEAERPGNAGRSTRYRGAGDVSCREDARGASRHPRPRKAPEDISPHIPGSLREHGRGTDGGGQGRSKGNTTATSPTQRQRVRRERDKGRISGLSVAIRTAGKYSRIM